MYIYLTTVFTYKFEVLLVYAAKFFPVIRARVPSAPPLSFASIVPGGRDRFEFDASP